jgi:hypothetical protein
MARKFYLTYIHPAGLVGIVNFRKKITVWQDDYPKCFDSQLSYRILANQSVLVAHSIRPELMAEGST